MSLANGERTHEWLAVPHAGRFLNLEAAVYATRMLASWAAVPQNKGRQIWPVSQVRHSVDRTQVGDVR